MFEMKPEYFTGIEQIDNEHKRLFEIANNLYELMKNDFIPDKYDNICTAIQELKDYTKYHFSDEEAYMQSVGHKNMFSQKVEHDAFLRKIEELEISDIDENQKAVIFDMLNFLNDWLIHHILEKDKLIAEDK